VQRPKIAGDVSGSANPLLGSWRLVSCETEAADGSIDYPLGEDAVGLLMYTEDGYMSVSLARAERHPFAGGDLLGGTGREKEQAAESYVSYCGRYEYCDDHVTHHVELSLFPNWSGQNQKRHVELKGARLTLDAPPFVIKGVEQRARLVWKRSANERAVS
jgi:hypothetical protein